MHSDYITKISYNCDKMLTFGSKKREIDENVVFDNEIVAL